MLIEDFPNSRTTFNGYSLLNHQRAFYPITPPYHHSPPYQELYGKGYIEPLHMNHQSRNDTSYQLQRQYFSSLTPPAFYPTLYPPSPPQSISPPSPILHQLVSRSRSAGHESNSGSNELLLENDDERSHNRRNSVIMKVQDQRIVPSFELSISAKGKSQSDSDEENFVCKWRSCFRIFETLEALAGHVSQCHAIASVDGLYRCQWYKCPRSDRGFNARYKMLVHVRTHTKEKPHACDQCFKSFSRAENLKIHIRSHSGEKPYVCPYEGCNKAYSNSSDRFKHTRTHSTEKPYSCKVLGCFKRYTDPSSLRKHVKTFKHVNVNLNPNDGIPPTDNRTALTSQTSEVFQNENNFVVVKPKLKCIHECCKQLRKSEMFHFGNLMDSVTLIDSTPMAFKYNNLSYQFDREWDAGDEPLDLSIHKVVKS